ncbi:ABC transporter permease subunit [Sporosarcina sp. FSL K6-1522]|uniref:ABC transporter permease subunit n=1 Tax=Sporosarcina sp. FSL K6-1522 TaxID=2921554 RepID=UPI00315B055A
MNVFKREMKASWKSLVFWSIGLVFIVGSGMGKYAALEGSGDSINELLGQMPASLRAIFGIGSLDVSTVVGYYGLLYLYLLIMAGIHAAMLGSTIISKEERDKTAEFLFVKPISRTTVISAKLAAAVAIVIIFNGITLISSIIFVDGVNEGAPITSEIMWLMGGMFMLQLLFLFFSTAIAACVRNSKLAIPISTGVLLVTFLLSVGMELTSKLDKLRYATPFKYFEAKTILHDGGYDMSFVVLSCLLMAVFMVMTYGFYRQRDLSL